MEGREGVPGSGSKWKEAQSKWGEPRLPGEDALGEGQGADLSGLRDLGVTLNTGEGGPHMVAGARKDAPLCSASWALTSCILESGACRGSSR